MKRFDKKFGADFISSLSTGPGIYRIFNDAGTLIYVGKAKNLRRRLSQYRNAKRRKKHAKMRSIVAEAFRIETELHETELSACLAETAMIQNERPKWNVEGAFYFLYPMMGLHFADGVLRLIYTTEPEAMDPALAKEFSFHGAYRSRFFSGNAFFSLVELFEYLGHKNKTQKFGKHTYLYSFRQIAHSWKEDLDLLFRGESAQAFEKLVLRLIESSSARRRPKEIQQHLNHLKRFWRYEAQLLHRVRLRLGSSEYPVPQKRRDLLFVEHRYGNLSAPQLRRRRPRNAIYNES